MWEGRRSTCPIMNLSVYLVVVWVFVFLFVVFVLF